MSGQTAGPNLGSLLDEVTTTPAAPAKKPRRTLTLRVPSRWQAWWDGRMADPVKRKKTILALRWGGAAAGLALAVGAFFALRPVPQPDYDTAAIDEVFNYTLLTDEFNNLPVEERLKLISQLVTRLRNLDGQGSVLLAAFASGIAGSARQQVEQNVSRLMVDSWDKYAKDYDKVPEDQRGEFLDGAMVSYMEMMEAVAGQTSEKPAAERLKEIKQQAKRDQQAIRNGQGPGSEEVGRVIGFINTNIGSYANPAQRMRGAQMLRDMTRHVRGQDISTGKPLNGPG